MPHEYEKNALKGKPPQNMRDNNRKFSSLMMYNRKNDKSFQWSSRFLDCRSAVIKAQMCR